MSSDLAVIGEGVGKVYDLTRGSTSQRATLAETISARLSLRDRNTDKAQPEDREVWALRDVDFSVGVGEIVGVIGRNGAGKSTLLKVLSRITEPTTGTVRIRGRTASLLEVGTGFHPELTGRENIFLNGAVLGMTKTEIASKFDEIVDFSGIEKFIDTPVKRYSSGMGVRLAFAVAAHLDPEILFIDEVLAVGDAAFQKKSLGRMQTLASDGRTVLFVSHNMNAIRNLCTRCLLFEDGRLRVDGSVNDCVDRYMSQVDDATSADVVVSDAPRLRPWGWESLQLHRVRLHSEAGSASVTCGETLEVSIEFECHRTSEHVKAGFYVQTRDGITPFFAWSHASSPIDTLTPGRYVATGRIDKNLLAPGRYFLGVLVATDRDDSGDWLPQVLEFEVRDQVHDTLEDLWLQRSPSLLKGVESAWTIDETPSR